MPGDGSDDKKYRMTVANIDKLAGLVQQCKTSLKLSTITIQ